MAPTSFRGRQPSQLRFGTSGLRGLVTDMTDLEVWVNVEGFVRFLFASGQATEGSTIYISQDLRPSSPRIVAAVAEAIQDSGCKPVVLTPVPTPALAYISIEQGSASVMVTGSHIPFDRNGIKFYRPDGEVLKSDEGPILESVALARRRAYEEDEASSRFGSDGMFLEPVEMNQQDSSARDAYLQRNTDFFQEGSLAGLKIAVYQHSAVGRDLMVTLLERLGAQVCPIGRSEGFVAVDTEAVDDIMVEQIAAMVPDAYDALGGLDAVVSTDGDSDRPLLLAVDPNHKLSFIRGDSLGAMVSELLELDALAIPVSVSDQVDLHLGHLGVAMQRTRIGSPWVIEAMASLAGARKGGFEANGGFLLETDLEIDGRSLKRLPTRDAMLPLLTVLSSVKRSGVALWDRYQALPSRSTTAGLLDDVPQALSQRYLAGYGFEGLSEAWLTPIRGRAPGREAHNLDSNGQDKLLRLAEFVASRWAGYELGQPTHFNWVDGVRMRFASGDVIHLRASGNAPQFRVYVTADSMQRARELVEAAVGPNGLVRSGIAECS